MVFIYLLAVLGLTCGTRDLGCIVRNHFNGTQTLFLVNGLSCSTACGILVPLLGIEYAFPELEGRFFTTGPPFYVVNYHT